MNQEIMKLIRQQFTPSIMEVIGDDGEVERTHVVEGMNQIGSDEIVIVVDGKTYYLKVSGA